MYLMYITMLDHIIKSWWFDALQIVMNATTTLHLHAQIRFVALNAPRLTFDLLQTDFVHAEMEIQTPQNNVIWTT